MRYKSAKTSKGNIGVSHDSQEAADMQAAEMDKNDCTGCHDCNGCNDCTGCHDCNGCHGCHGCTDCTGCTGCTGCHGTDCNGCTGCTDCTGCTGCTDCHDCNGCRYCTDTQGALRWDGEPAKDVFSLNGLRWPVSTDGKSIQIGCQHHSVDEWRAFDDWVIAKMDEEALTFWKRHKEMILSLAEVRKTMEEGDERT